MKKKRAAILISGGGSNLQAFIDAVEAGSLAMDIPLVVSNRPDAGGLERARAAGIETAVIEHSAFDNRDEFDRALAEYLGRYQPDLIVLAGFMRILGVEFVSRFSGRILNIHPSLLPAYPGLDTHQRVLDAGDRWHGCTVHFVNEQLDGGPPIIQGRVPVLDDDDAATLAARVLEVEHTIYPIAAEHIAEGRLRYRDGEVWLDGEMLSEPIQYRPQVLREHGFAL